MTGTQPWRAYPSIAPAYYLGRPAEWWTTALSARRRPADEAVRQRLGCTVKEPQ